MDVEEHYEIGEVVWAKIKGYPWWPCIVVEFYNSNDQKDFLVNFIGENSHATLNQNYIAKFLKNLKLYSQTKQKKCLDSIKIAQKILNGQTTYQQEKNILEQKKKQSYNKVQTYQKQQKKQRDEKKQSDEKQQIDEKKQSDEKKQTEVKKKVKLEDDQKILKSDVKQLSQIEMTLNDNLDSLKEKLKQKQNSGIYIIIENIIEELNKILENQYFQKKDKDYIYNSQIGILFTQIQNLIQNLEQNWDIYKQKLENIQTQLNNQIIYQVFFINQNLTELENRDESLFNQSEFSFNQKSESQFSTSNQIQNQEIRKKACNKLAKIFNHKYGYEKKESQMKALMVDAIIRRIDPDFGKQYRENMSLILKISNNKLFDVQQFAQQGFNFQEYKNILDSYEEQQKYQN